MASASSKAVGAGEGWIWNSILAYAVGNAVAGPALNTDSVELSWSPFEIWAYADARHEAKITEWYNMLNTARQDRQEDSKALEKTTDYDTNVRLQHAFICRSSRELLKLSQVVVRRVVREIDMSPGSRYECGVIRRGIDMDYLEADVDGRRQEDINVTL